VTPQIANYQHAQRSGVKPIGRMASYGDIVLGINPQGTALRIVGKRPATGSQVVDQFRGLRGTGDLAVHRGAVAGRRPVRCWSPSRPHRAGPLDACRGEHRHPGSRTSSSACPTPGRLSGFIDGYLVTSRIRWASSTMGTSMRLRSASPNSLVCNTPVTPPGP
jgi:hypothetical protein